MRITAIREVSVPLQGNLSNSLVSFAEHTVSLVAIECDVRRQGRPLVGYAFDSIGRYAQPGLLRERFIPRLLAAAPASLLDDSGMAFDPARACAVMLRNEKPGGHGDRAAAIAALELAFWDLNAKLNDEPAFHTIARRAGRTVRHARAPVYAAGGYYYGSGDGCERLRQEFQGYQDRGFSKFKMKVGGAPLAEDLARIEAALEVAGEGSRLAVDANGRFETAAALRYAQAIAPYALRWFEEIGDPLDYALNQRVAQDYAGPIATGENLFSLADVNNLLRYAGLRPDRDILQMDAGLSYGLSEYLRMIQAVEAAGFDRRSMHPHGGHLINLHIAVGLGLGGCEAYPGVFQPFGGYSPQCALSGGEVGPSDAPGFGLEQKPELAAAIEALDRR
ncbi:enolase C-terminal domain-like protein [Bordetella genomosp. 12]|uniref:Mandelate racemase n=1 Tax=Bordetella genomosp. 12 TaxID=463035 RepID=A0A261VMM2_9BORD|nr:enolase C-terminal domain-like protein [Bordetella genomosp. 12]OZI74830.1 mandelate racemase [Bordetella genomosp. 12]